MKSVGNNTPIGLVSQPLVRPEVVAHPKAPDKTTPLGTGSATNEHKTLLGAVPEQRSADPLVAKGLVESVAFALSGSTRDVEAYVRAPTVERLEKVNRGLAHLLKEASSARESQDVQLVRMKGDLKPSIDRVENGFTQLLSAFAKIESMPAAITPEAKKTGGLQGFIDGLFSAPPVTSIPKDAQRAETLRQEGTKLLDQLSALLTKGVALEIPKDWSMVTLGGESITRSSPAVPSEIYPTLADGRKRTVPESAVRAHLRGEMLLAQGDARGAVQAFQQAASDIYYSDHVTRHNPPSEVGIAMLYLADAITATGLEKTPISFQRADHQSLVDVTGLYTAAVNIMRQHNKEDSPIMQHTIPRVHAGLRELGELDAASNMVRSATEGKWRHINVPHLLDPTRGDS